MKVTASIPETALAELVPDWISRKASSADVRAAASDLLHSALDRRLEPAQAGPAGGHSQATVRVTLHVKQASQVAFRRACKASGLPPAACVRGLLLGLQAAGGYEPPALTKDHPMAKLNEALRGAGAKHALPRVEQGACYDEISDALDAGAIGLVEAGTGVGKTRAELAALTAWAKREGTVACLAVPTLALVRQVAEEHALQASIFPSLPPLRAIRGRREFVSVSALEAYLADPPEKLTSEQTQAIKAWVEAGGPGVGANDPAWLIEGLERASESAEGATELPTTDLTLASLTYGEDTEKDPGFVSYRDQFAREPKPGPLVVLCTHAMLAQDLRQRMRHVGRDEDFRALTSEINESFKRIDGEASKEKTERLDRLRHLIGVRGELIAGFASEEDVGLLPPWRALVIDEAQQLEAAFSNALSEQISLHALMQTVRAYREAGGRVTKTLLNDLGEAFDRLKENNLSGELSALSRAEDVRGNRQLLSLISTILQDIPVPRSKSGQDARVAFALRIARERAIINRMLSTNRGYISFSPRYRWPRLYLGPRSVESYFKAMWNMASAGAVVSATLYTYRAESFSASYQRELLGIPKTRAREYTPIHPGWVRNQARVHLPSPDTPAEKRLPAPPKGTNPGAEEQRAWHAAIAAEIERIYTGAAGGVLVLTTSYETIRALEKRLQQLDSALVVAAPGMPLRVQMKAFYLTRLAGIRPLWLAVGAAWTGIDVGGHSDYWREISGSALSESQDDVLTDLVIPRLPYNVNQSIPYRWRVQNKPQFPWAHIEASFTFAQGVGRLIRRPGLNDNRNIWVLDSRLAEDGSDTHRALFLNFLKRYPRRERL